MTEVATPSSTASLAVRQVAPRRCARASAAINASEKPSLTPPLLRCASRSSTRQFARLAATTAPSSTAIHDTYIHNRKIGIAAIAPYTV